MLVSKGSIYYWHKNWREAGLKGLENKAKSGRPKQATAAYCALLEEVIEQEPSVYGYGFGIWTVDRLREHLRRETGISLSNRRFRALLNELDIVYRRPKHDLSSLQDAEEKERAKVLLDWLKKDVPSGGTSSSLWMKRP